MTSLATTTADRACPPTAALAAAPVYFQVADTPALRAEASRLRYKVYCDELGFLDKEAYPEEVETDAFDEVSTHIVAIQRDSIVGTVRIVPKTSYGFPLESHCHVTSDIPRSSAELSRVVVDLRARQGKTGFAYGTTWNTAGISIWWGLWLEVYYLTKQRGITHWFGAMERPFVTMLRRAGIPWEAVGPEVDYYGPIVPYRANVNMYESLVRQKKPAVYDQLRRVTRPQAAGRLQPAA